MRGTLLTFSTPSNVWRLVARKPYRQNFQSQWVTVFLNFDSTARTASQGPSTASQVAGEFGTFMTLSRKAPRPQKVISTWQETE